MNTTLDNSSEDLCADESLEIDSGAFVPVTIKVKNPMPLVIYGIPVVLQHS